jgi:lysozyme family protein
MVFKSAISPQNNSAAFLVYTGSQGKENMTIEQACDFTIPHEGADSDDPQDPGGYTRFGIAQRWHPDVDVRSLTKEKAVEIYRKGYWLPCWCDKLPARFRLPVFDAAVNMGWSASIRLLQRTLGLYEDGFIGPTTLNAATAGDTHENFIALVNARKEWYKSIKGYERFGNGWLTRCDDLINYSGVILGA